MENPCEEQLTTIQLCEWLKIGKSTVSRWKAQGLPYVGTTRHLLYNKSDVIKWIERNTSIATYFESITDKLMTEKEFCNWIQISPVTAWRWRREGMPFLGGKKTIRYNKQHVINWLKDKGRW